MAEEHAEGAQWAATRTVAVKVKRVKDLEVARNASHKRLDCRRATLRRNGFARIGKREAPSQ
jgi:hypothetical protein